MKIYIGFAKPTSGGFVPLAWIIQKVISRPYDHCYIRFQEPDSEYMIFQASGFAVNLFNKDIWSSINVSVKEYEIDISDAQYQMLWQFIKANLGIPYSLLEDFGILLMKIFKIKQPFNQGLSAEFCSKLGAEVCQRLNIAFSQDPGSIDPSTLDTILEQNKFVCVLNPIF